MSETAIETRPAWEWRAMGATWRLRHTGKVEIEVVGALADAIAALVRLTTCPRSGEVFNLASGEDHSIAELLDRLVALSGLAVRCEEDPEKLRPVDVPRLCGDAARLRALGWEPERGVEAALCDLFDEARSRAAGSSTGRGRG